MLYYSRGSRQKVFHQPDCRYAKKRGGQWSEFRSPDEAHAAGYRECRCCDPIGYLYYKEKNTINKICQKSDIICRQQEGRLWVETSLSGWCMESRKYGRSLALYHRNTDIERKQDPNCPILGYHLQNAKSSTISKYLRYIEKHDCYRLIHPDYAAAHRRSYSKKGTKRKKHAREKRRARNAEAQRVEDLINAEAAKQKRR